MENNEFLNVFKNIKLSENVKTNLKNSIVTSIKINEVLKSIKICLLNNEIIDEDCFIDFKNNIIDVFPYIQNVDVILKYNLTCIDLSNIINGFKENILKEIKRISNICFNIIKDSSWSVSQNSLTIEVFNNSAFVLKAKNIDDKIKQIFKQKFDVNVNVEFLSLKISKQQKKQKQQEQQNQLLNELYINKNVLKQKEEQVDEKQEISLKKPIRTSLKVNKIKDKIVKIKGSINSGEKITISGKIFKFDLTETKKGKYILKVDITDKTDSISFKFFTTPENYHKTYKELIKKGNFVIVKGEVYYDDYTKELLLMAKEIDNGEPFEMRMDNCDEKRVELHLHTQMSKMDGVAPVKELIKRAYDWGHKAIAITDHAVVQAFPDAMDIARKLGIKVIYGVEAYIVDDISSVVQNSRKQTLDKEFVVFDLETTGLNREYNKIIEIGAVKIKNGEIVDYFSSFVNPHEKLTSKIIELTNITDDMLKDAPEENDVLPRFFEFFNNAVLVAHNAKFDMGFIKKWAQRNNKIIENTVLDTVGLSRAIFPEMAKHTLNVLAKKLGVVLENHHRAVDDANATAQIFIKFIDILKEKNINNLDEINKLASVSIDVKKLRPSHAIILVKNQKGLRNLYELISDSHLDYFFKNPRIPKSKFLKLKDGLIIGTACEAGEFYQAVLNNADEDEIEKLASFYDYFEIQPLENNKFLIDSERVSNINSFDDLKQINCKIVEYGERYKKPVVATGDVHFLDPEDECFRRIIQFSQGYNNCDNQPPLYFKTTEEMLEEFSYLGEEKSKEVVIYNTNLIADLIEDVLPIPDGIFPPQIEGADLELRKITYEKAKSIYGETLPKIVSKRLERELSSIISNGFAVLYIIAQKIVWHSNENGYIVGSRGSVGSSFVATMAGITEVNPLSPHYFCKNCKYSDFDSEEVSLYAGNSGWDLPDKDCPNCGNKLFKDGHDIPFETFLGFNGDKEPDIDLNFSGEFQQQAHLYTEELFGKGNVFKAGTIGTLADKTAYGFIKKYTDEKNIKISGAETNRLIEGCIGAKRTTGQHPGGLMVVPNNKSIYDFCPVQRPADDAKSNVITTHFDYHSISGRILKLDLLGHDVPTILRFFKEFTGFDPLDVPMDDKKTMSLFTSPKELGVNSKDIDCETGSLGLPEFGTNFVIQMLMDTKPSTFSELVRISGLSHGTDVWFNNAQELIKNKTATLKEVIPTRDDIMVYLIIKGIENKMAFTIMESVRKGKGLTKEFEDIMIKHNVPDWYIESCKKIKYMFPKGHAVAYVTNAFRIGYFKINYPETFYAALFSVKVEDFDYDLMCFGIDKVKNAISEIENKGKEATTKEKSKLVILELVREMYARGLKFAPMSLYDSKAIKFDLKKEGILPPLCTVQGLGENAAFNIVEARKDGEFYTIENLIERTKISKTVVEVLKINGVLNGIPDTNQLTLFNL